MTRLRAVLALLVLAVAAKATGFDEPFAVERAPEWLARPARVVTHLGDTSVVVVIALLAGLLTRRRGRWRPLRVAVVASLLTAVLKELVRRPRPPGAAIGAFSFPSAHAVRSMALALALAALWRRPWLVALAVAVGLSRLVLGLHWPADVLGGWLLAYAVAGHVDFRRPRPDHGRGMRS